MAGPYEITFGNLKEWLIREGFAMTIRDEAVMFGHKSGRPIFFLRSYEADQVVEPIHLMMVRKQLEDAGVAPLDEPRLRVPKGSTESSKA